MLRGLFALAERLFGVTVEERAWTVGTWHDDVRFFAVKNASGEDIRRVLSALGVACGRRIYTKGGIAALKSGVKVF